MIPIVIKTEQSVGSPEMTKTLIPCTNRILPVCNRSQWNRNKPTATNTTPMGKTFQNKLNDSSVTALVIGTGPVRVMDNPL